MRPLAVNFLLTMKAGIFDLDGVIVDTAKYHYLAWKRLAHELGFEFSEAHNERLKGVSRLRSLEFLLEVGGLHFTNSQKVSLADKKNAWYVEYISRMTESELLPGAKPYLQQIRSTGVRTALASASRNAGLLVDRTMIRDQFDVIVDGIRARRAKPDPQGFLLAAHDLGLPPADCVVFEDAAAGIAAARNAGMHVVGIGRPEILHDADLIVPSLAELL